MVALDANYDGSEIFHIQFQTDGLSAAVGEDDAVFTEQSRFQKIVHDGGDGGLVQTGSFGETDSGNRTVFVDISEDQCLVGALQIGGEFHAEKLLSK